MTFPRLLDSLLWLFYPPRCLVCDRQLIDDEQFVCFHCLCELPNAYYHRQTDNPLAALYAGIPQMVGAAAFLRYEKEGSVQTLIHDFKYNNNRALAEYLGRMAVSEMADDGIFEGVDFLAPVPLHRKKERQRGYNQSLLIARGMSAVSRIPVRDDILVRKVYTLSQTRKSLYDRHLNTEDVFAARPFDDLQGKHIMLVDDVVTTGATSIACIEALTKANPNVRLSIFSLASVAR